MNHKKYWDKIHQKGPFCMVLSRNSPARWGGSLTLSGRNVRSQSMRCAIIDYTEQRLGSSHDVVSHSKRIIVYFPAALGFWSIRCWLAGEPVGFPDIGFSPMLALLIKAGILISVSSITALTGTSPTKAKRSPCRCISTSHGFGISLGHVHLRRKSVQSVSYYALFQGWLCVLISPLSHLWNASFLIDGSLCTRKSH